jgi:hypothetical protein
MKVSHDLRQLFCMKVVRTVTSIKTLQTEINCVGPQRPREGIVAG